MKNIPLLLNHCSELFSLWYNKELIVRAADKIKRNYFKERRYLGSKDRKFIEIDRDNFNNVLEGMKPRLAFKVDNKLTEEDTKIAVELRFKSIDDFHPEQVADQITPVRKLVEARQRLSDLLNKLDGNDRLDELLQDVITSTDSLQKLGEEAGVKKLEENKE